MLQVDHFSAWVTVDGVELPQYAIEYSLAEKHATCWIASEAGKKFSVNWKDSRLSYPTSGKVTIDAIPCGHGMHLYPVKHPRYKGKNTTRKSSFPTSTTTERPFMFSELELTDDDKYLNVPTSELGDIKLEIHEFKIKSVKHFQSKKYTPAPVMFEKIHERSKKAVGHRLRLGDEFVVGQSCSLTRDIIRHVCTFVFKYRPLAILQANGIAPLEKGRKRVPFNNIEGDNAGSKSDSLRIEHLEAESLKRGKGSKRIKTEQKPEAKVAKPRYHGIGQLGDVIDLT